MTTPVNDLPVKLPDSLSNVTTQIWPVEKQMWISLIFKTADDREKFLENESISLKDRATLLPLVTTLGSTRSCLKIVCSFDCLERILTVLFGAFPGLCDFMEKDLRK